MLLHRSTSPHPERPARMVAIYDELIRRGLAEAVAKTDAWVFTSGDGSSPVDKLVGRAMQYGGKGACGGAVGS